MVAPEKGNKMQSTTNGNREKLSSSTVLFDALAWINIYKVKCKKEKWGEIPEKGVTAL